MSKKGVLIPFDLLDELTDYFQQRADVKDGSDGPRPNREMLLQGRLESEVTQPEARLTAPGRMAEWLLKRERDIAVGMEDFDELRDLFRDLFGRDAQSTTSERDSQMIELRWALQHRGYIEKERVLQYRETTGSLVNEHGWHVGYEWSEWKDVPEVDVPNVPSAASGKDNEKGVRNVD